MPFGAGRPRVGAGAAGVCDRLTCVVGASGSGSALKRATESGHCNVTRPEEQRDPVPTRVPAAEAVWWVCACDEQLSSSKDDRYVEARNADDDGRTGKGCGGCATGIATGCRSRRATTIARPRTRPVRAVLWLTRRRNVWRRMERGSA